VAIGVRSPPILFVGHMATGSSAGRLFEADLPSGFHYRDNFIAREDETSLVDAISRLEFSTFEMRGVAARRRVAFFGRAYDQTIGDTPPLPEFLLSLRAQVAVWADVEPAAFAMALINEYPPGAPIGWHRDAPQYDIVAGVSLLATCRVRFRPYVRPHGRGAKGRGRRTATHEIVLERRSGYLMTGESRAGFEHHIPAVTTLRYSITFRTLRP
jgi:alkylated DNA repair dioxygenase AlkB